MHPRRNEYERIRTVVAEAKPDRPLTARELLSLLDEHDEEFDSPHEVATVLGYQANQDDVTVIESSPYRYRIEST